MKVSVTYLFSISFQLLIEFSNGHNIDRYVKTNYLAAEKDLFLNNANYKLIT